MATTTKKVGQGIKALLTDDEKQHPVSTENKIWEEISADDDRMQILKRLHDHNSNEYGNKAVNMGVVIAKKISANLDRLNDLYERTESL